MMPKFMFGTCGSHMHERRFQFVSKILLHETRSRVALERVPEIQNASVEFKDPWNNSEGILFSTSQ